MESEQKRWLPLHLIHEKTLYTQVVALHELELHFSLQCKARGALGAWSVVSPQKGQSYHTDKSQQCQVGRVGLRTPVQLLLSRMLETTKK